MYKFKVGDVVELKSLFEIENDYGKASLHNLYGKIPYWMRFQNKILRVIATDSNDGESPKTYKLQYNGEPVCSSVDHPGYLNWPEEWLRTPIREKIRML